VVENCTGSSGACPTDGVLPSGTVCKARVSDPCDLDDLCTGGVTCPVRAANVGTVCRNAVNVCDVAETCNGSESCPGNAFAPAGTDCSSGATYTGPMRTKNNCGGVDMCHVDAVLQCVGQETCSGTSSACNVCSCICD
jgi:hypothetical protein